MIKVGITGGIGSGKSLVCRIFSKLGAPVYDADIAARYLVETDPEIRESLIMLMGSDIYTGKFLNRSKMSVLIFNNKSLLEEVNQIIHPKVAEHFQWWCKSNTDYAYVIQESALLFESKAYLMFDRYVTVTSPEEVRIQRIISRKDMSLEKIRAIMQSQLQEQEKIVRSHHVVVNDGMTPVLPQVLQLHASFLTNV
jgi:dephospho-CoA kinase